MTKRRKRSIFQTTLYLGDERFFPRFMNKGNQMISLKNPKGAMRVAGTMALAGVLSATSLVALGAQTAGASKTYTIAFNVGVTSDPFFLTMRAGATAEAKKLGVNLEWQGNVNYYSPATQLPFLQSALASKPDALIFAPTDTKALEPITNQFVAAGVPVFNVDSGNANQKNIVSWITGNNVQGGQAAADALAKAMNYSASGTYNVVIGVSSVTTSTDAARLAGFKAEIKAKYPKIVLKNVFATNSVSATAISDINQALSANPGATGTASGLSGIFAIDGTDAAGAVAALTAKGKLGKVALVGYDAYATSVSQLGKGGFSALIAQQPYLEGQLAVKAAVSYLKNGKSASAAGIMHLNTLANKVLTATTSASVLKKYTYRTK